MKKTFFLLLVVAAFSCNSDGNGSASDDTSGANTPGVENVNGNIPDTTNAINLESQKGDTTQTDTTHHH